MTEPPAPGTYTVTVNDLSQEGSYGVFDKQAYWDGHRWIGLFGFEVVVKWEAK